MEESLKSRAEEIIEAVDHDLQDMESKTATIQKEVDTKADAIMDRLFGVVSDVDIEAATKRVRSLKEKDPKATREELSQKLIREKCQRTGTVGAVTSGAGLIPGVGTAAAVALGVAADIGATFKLQAELVLEIAAVYDYPLTDDEKQRLVMVITGLSAGTSALARRAGQAASVKIGEKFAEKAVLKALPIVGVIASAGTNVLSTYVIGQRADAYFRLGPEAVGSWSDSLRAISGVDERNIATWLAESGAAVATGINRVGQVSKSAGEVAAGGAVKAADVVGSGAKIAGQTAQAGFKAYFRRVFHTWATIFGWVGTAFGFLWAIVMSVPRRIVRLFRR